MSIKDHILKPHELRDAFNKILDGLIDVKDLSGTEKAHLEDFALKEKNLAIEDIGKLLTAQPNTTFEYWSQKVIRYPNAEKVLYKLQTPVIDKILEFKFEKLKDKDEELFKEKKRHADAITDILKKIEFWHVALQEWEFKLSLEVLQTSGEVVAKTGLHNTKFFFDKMVQSEIDKLKDLKLFEKVTDNAEPIESASERLNWVLEEYRFFELILTKKLSEEGRKKIIEYMTQNGLPYTIAMFEYVNFFTFLRNEYFSSNTKLFEAISGWFDVGYRQISGNFNVLSPKTKENKERYTSWKCKEIVKIHYQELI